MYRHYKDCQSDARNSAAPEFKVQSLSFKVVNLCKVTLFPFAKSSIYRAFFLLLQLWTLDLKPWTHSLARYVHIGTVASLIIRLRPRRHHYTERGLPLCFNTFRAFLQLSFLSKPDQMVGLFLCLHALSDNFAINRRFVQIECSIVHPRDGIGQSDSIRSS